MEQLKRFVSKYFWVIVFGGLGVANAMVGNYLAATLIGLIAVIELVGIKRNNKRNGK